MKTVDSVDLGRGRVVELSQPERDDAVSILYRYPSDASQKNVLRSCDISAKDLLPMLNIALKHDLLSLHECAEAFQALLEYMVSDGAVRWHAAQARPIRTRSG